MFRPFEGLSGALGDLITGSLQISEIRDLGPGVQHEPPGRAFGIGQQQFTVLEALHRIELGIFWLPLGLYGFGRDKETPGLIRPARLM